jgi:HK97 family phage portal protein
LIFRRREARALDEPTTPKVAAYSGTWAPRHDVFTDARITPRVALQLADVWACVRVLSDAASSIPLVPYRRGRDGARARYPGHIADLLRQPAPSITSADLIGQTIAHLNLWGDAFIGKYRGPDGTIRHLRMLAPDRMVVELIEGEPRYTWTDDRGRRKSLDATDVCHVRGLSLDGITGLSPVERCADLLGLSRYLVRHALAFFADGAFPGAVINLDGRPNKAQRDEFLLAWEGRHQGRYSVRRKIGLLWGGATYQPMTQAMDDMQFTEQRELAAVEMARIFRIPPHKIGAKTGDSNTYANVEQANLEFVTDSLRPWLVRIEQAITNDPDLCPGPNFYVEFLLDALLRSDAKSRAQFYMMAINGGWMTIDEVRQRENLDPLPAPSPTPPKELTT